MKCVLWSLLLYLFSAFFSVFRNTQYKKMNIMNNRTFHKNFQPIWAAGQDLQVQLCWRHKNIRHVSRPRRKLSWVSIDWLQVLNPWLLQNLRHRRGPFKFVKDYRHAQCLQASFRTAYVRQCNSTVQTAACNCLPTDYGVIYQYVELSIDFRYTNWWPYYTTGAELQRMRVQGE